MNDKKCDFMFGWGGRYMWRRYWLSQVLEKSQNKAIYWRARKSRK
jgi:hypothetical protein